jgi:hypothetical protein
VVVGAENRGAERLHLNTRVHQGNGLTQQRETNRGPAPRARRS